MIDSTKAASTATSAAAAAGGTPAATTAAKGAKSFAETLAASKGATAKTAKTAKAAARPDGEQTKKVAGHPYAQIVNGTDKGLFLNQVAGNPRQGEAFKLVARDHHVFHVYGSGKDRVVVEVKAKSATAAAPGSAPATTSS